MMRVRTPHRSGTDGSTTSSADSERRRVLRLWTFAAALAVVAVVSMALGHIYVAGDGLMSASLAASAVAHFGGRPGRREIAATLALAVVIFLAFGPRLELGGLDPRFARAVSALGLASLVMRVAWLARGRLPDWTSARATPAALAILSPMFSLAFATAIGLPGLVRRDLFDGYVMACDRALFFGRIPPLVVARFLSGHAALHALAALFYWAPAPLGVFVYLGERRRGTDADVITALLVGGFVGYVFFAFFPVVGPGYVLPGFPNVVSLTPVLAGIPVDVPRNCMPSLHMTNAFVIAAHTRRLGGAAWGALGAATVVFTILATLGFGCHYAADLLAAVPFTYGTLGLARGDTRRAAVGVGLTVAFLFVVRFAFA